MRGLLSGLVALSLLASPVAAQDVRRFEPVSDWALDHDDEKCVLRREFAYRERRAKLEMRRSQIGGPLLITAISQDMPLRMEREVYLTLKPHDKERQEYFAFKLQKSDGAGAIVLLYSPQQSRPFYDTARSQFLESSQSAILNPDEITAFRQAIDLGLGSDAFRELFRSDNDFSAAYLRADAQFIHSQAFRAAQREFEDSIEEIELSRAFNRTATFDLHGMREPMEALNQCVEELQTHWDIDAEAHKTLWRWVRPVTVPNARSELFAGLPNPEADHPSVGYMIFRLNVSAEGSPTDCHVQSPIDDLRFTEAACAALMDRATFEPALDAGGQPIASYFHFTIAVLAF